VHRLPREGAEDQDVDRSLQEIGRCACDHGLPVIK
jgi:hypothetical protein